MIYVKRSIPMLIVILNIFFLCTCNKKTYVTTNGDIEYKKYSSAKKKLNHNNYKDAIKELENLNKKYPLNPYNNQIYLDLIYAYYKSSDFQLTIKTIEHFIKINPNHPNIDYPLYIQGLTNMEIDNNLSNKLFKSNHVKKNPEHAYESFRKFSQLINQYPNSQYIIDAHKRLIYLKNRIAKHELAIIEYYSTKEAYIAVINRSEDMLRYFSDTYATQHALQYMYASYKKLNLIDQSNKVMKIITCNKK